MTILADLISRLPIRVRLSLAFAGVMIVLFGGLALLLHTRFVSSLDAGINRGLRTRAADLATLVRAREGRPLRPGTQLPESGGAFAQVLTPSGGIVDSTPGHGAKSLLTRDEVRRALNQRVLIARRENARVVAEPLAAPPAAVLVVGSSLSQRDRALRTLDEMLFIGGPILLVLTCVAGYALAAFALAPVERMRGRAARISGSGHGDRLPVPRAHDELYRLGDTLNQMLNRLEEAMDRERVFVANAGHELRTPLTILKLELEVTLTERLSHEDLERRLQSAAEEVDRLSKLAEDLLVIARADQGRLPVDKRPVEIEPVLRAVTDRIAGAARGESRLVRAESAGSLVVPADRDRLEQALTNMVTNALNHGNGPVLLTARERNGHVEMHVLDEGPGFAPEFLPRVFERFSRADPARSRGGAGLGLSIVRAIAEAHGGTAEAANRAEGGAVSVRART
ncbi:MAG: HAMP domain-containing protein [Actinobacteria bacterium]|nr:MAG: HAMP domain-containing protein [Actinomycetota bacterium]